MPQPPSLPHSPSTLQLLETLKITHQHSPLATPSLTFIPFLATDNSLPHSLTHSAEDTSACNETQLTLTHNTQQLTLLLTHSFRAFLGCLLFNHSCTALLHSYLTHRTRCTDATVAPSRAHAELLAQLDHTVFRIFLRLTSSPEIENDVECAQAFPDILSLIGGVRLPRLLSLFAVMGESNKRYSQQIFNSITAHIPQLLRSECITCAAGTHKTLCDITRRLDALINPEIAIEKKHKVVDLSKSRPKKNTLKTRDVFSERGAGLKNSGQGLSDEVCDLAEFVMDVVHSLFIWIESGANVLVGTSSNKSGNLGLDLISSSGMFVSPSCAVVVACMSLLYEFTIPLLERVVAGATGNTAERKTRVQNIALVSREMLVQALKTMFSASLDASSSEDDSFHDEGNRDDDKRMYIGWEEIVEKLLSAGEEFDDLTPDGGVAWGGNDALRVILGGGGLLADVTRAHSTTFYTWFEKIFRKADAARKQYILTVLYEGEAGYLSRDILVAPPAELTESYVDYHGHSDTKKADWQATTEAVRSASSSKPAPQNEDSQKANINTIRSIFPDYGDTFVTAVLRAFDDDPDRALDALLSDNLPPTLTQMDRTSSLKVKAAFVGKSSTDAAVTVARKAASNSTSSGKASTLSYSLEMNRKDRDLQKKIINTLNQQEEMDDMLLSDVATDFIDDYDDQYDDAGRGTGNDDGVSLNNGGKKSSAQRNSTSIIIDKKGKAAKPKAPKAITKGSLRGIGTDSADPTSQQSERDRVIRLNKLMREKEAEDEFWVGMQNTNHSEKNRVARKNKFQQEESEEGGDSETGDEDTKNNNNADSSSDATNAASVDGGGLKSKVTVKVSDAPVKGSNKNKGAGGKPGPGSAGAGAGGRSKKPKTKTFDKHNQKNKSTKKFGGFS